MKTFNITPTARLPYTRPSARRTRVLQRRRIGKAMGYGSILCAVIAFAWVMVGDRFWLAAPAGASAVVLAQLVLYRYNEKQLQALLGNALGQCSLLLWLIIDLVVRRMIGFDFSLIQTFQDAGAS